VHRGSALDLPFADHSFDVVWMQNVGMNIADKRKLYAEIHRVLEPGGRYAFQEMTAGTSAPSHFPLPWATDPDDSFLVSAENVHSLGGERHWLSSSESRTKAGNARRSLEEAGRLVPGTYRV
jgi:SAM-dependent methyltransferase